MTADLILDNKKPWIIALIIAITFFTVNGIVTFHSANLINKNADRITHTLHILNLIEQLKFHLFRAESGQRGYLLTNDADYLVPYNESNIKARMLLETLSETEIAIPEQKQKFSRLSKLLNEKLNEMSDGIEFINKDQNKKAVRLVKTDKGYKLTLEILALIDEMEMAEQVYLNKKRVENDESQQYISQILLTANLAGLCLAILALHYTFRSGIRIKHLVQEIETNNSHLEEKVEQRTEELKHYAQELERSNKELEDFAFIASHDLQEPLRKIRAFGERLEKGFAETLGPQGQDYLARMQSASSRMSRLIEDLLAFSRVTSRQREFIPVDMNNLLNDVIDAMDYAINEKTAQIKLGKLPVIEGDASQLHQVFSNLLSNSLKFVAEGKNPEININTRETTNFNDKPYLIITFSDNGIGFDEQYKDRIFNLFQRLHGKDEYTGTGIGLAICRKIVESHGGKIEVASQPGRGTTFSLWFPSPA
jgi:signal transduction histidine kinase